MRLISLLLLLVAGTADAEIYKCVEDGGRITYSNLQSKGCTRLNVGPPASAPATKSEVPAQRTSGATGFPKVDSGTQRWRDDDRRRILDQELANEQTALQAARKTLEEQEAIIQPDERNIAGRGINSAKLEQRLQPLRDKVSLHERNIEALRKEISNLR